MNSITQKEYDVRRKKIEELPDDIDFNDALKALVK